jgi:hypothetical protein
MHLMLSFRIQQLQLGSQGCRCKQPLQSSPAAAAWHAPLLCGCQDWQPLPFQLPGGYGLCCVQVQPPPCAATHPAAQSTLQPASTAAAWPCNQEKLTTVDVVTDHCTVSNSHLHISQNAEGQHACI